MQKRKKVLQDVRERRLELCRDEDERKEGESRSTEEMNSFRSTEFFANSIALLLSTLYMHYSQNCVGAKLLQGCVRGRDGELSPGACLLRARSRKTTLGGGRVLKQVMTYPPMLPEGQR